MSENESHSSTGSVGETDVDGLGVVAGLLAGALGVVAGLLDVLVSALGVVAGLLGVSGALGLSEVEGAAGSEAVGVGDSVANAAGAARNVAGAITAVAAARAIARRSFMKTSVKSGVPHRCSTELKGLPRWGYTGEAVDTHA
ncbi:hypothetical protein HRW18_18160 [Streptomyces lunaelactis]|uniref:hypothetical protein n=1 Tax=Streptomyces lunaelactis TaxID=1535768 RepID=UPI001584A2ED|nr:hypothetical protein [Streptomyces lunaelactis]NUK09890.1 hypothetical protein [Streptomyces lunaelactis]NUL12082.1 hypothetical protein [Streptomyces lunaelactis]NUL24717.1 hypothetical protein [Streptomyces lunaelactis]